MSTGEIISQLNQAKELAFSNKNSFPQVLRHIFNFVNNPDVEIQRWCAAFIKESFNADETKLDHANKIELAIDSIDSLVALLKVRDIDVYSATIDSAIVVYKLVFRYVADNDGCGGIWAKLNELKQLLVSRFTSQFPLEDSFNEEVNQTRNLHCKVLLLRFVIVVIDFQTKSPSHVKNFSLARVNAGHTLIRPQVLEPELAQYLDLVLAVFKQEILVPPILTATLNHLLVICRRKPQFINRILSVIDAYDTTARVQSNFQSVESFKLAKKYVDRGLRIFINHLLRNQMVPTQYQSSLNRKLNTLIARGDEIRKKNILAESADDASIRKRRFDGFANDAKKVKQNDFKSLYGLIEPTNELNNFDLSTVPQNILVLMVLAALNKASVKKVTGALDIIYQRYADVLKGVPASELKQEPLAQYEVKRLEAEADDDKFNPDAEFSLPPPQPLLVAEKKEHVNLIIRNFFKLANKDVAHVDDSTPQDEVSKELTKVAIKLWKKNLWLVLLTRLATRGMHGQQTARDTDQLADLVRTAIFDYFLDNIHTRIDTIIEWLNEEWYSERVFNEKQQKEQIREKAQQEYDADSSIDLQKLIDERTASLKVETPNYIKWAGKVLDLMIPFLEPTDRKIFIRLLSDLPYLDEDLVSRIKSLCFDPVRVKIGFLSLQFLIMYRPPMKEACLAILKELSTSDQEDLKEEAGKLLAKYA